MQSYCTDYLATLPDITVYINCDTRLAINLKTFGLGDNDEFIFAIKNLIIARKRLKEIRNERRSSNETL